MQDISDKNIGGMNMKQTFVFHVHLLRNEMKFYSRNKIVNDGNLLTRCQGLDKSVIIIAVYIRMGSRLHLVASFASFSWCFFLSD